MIYLATTMLLQSCTNSMFYLPSFFPLSFFLTHGIIKILKQDFYSHNWYNFNHFNLIVFLYDMIERANIVISNDHKASVITCLAFRCWLLLQRNSRIFLIIIWNYVNIPFCAATSNYTNFTLFNVRLATFFYTMCPNHYVYIVQYECAVWNIRVQTRWIAWHERALAGIEVSADGYELQ